MENFKMTFARYEKKYVITRSQKAKLLALIGSRLTPDIYGESTVCNIYFDTPDYRLIRASIEKPAFKEKLRIRAYDFPDRDSNVFAEIKRKCDGVVYKRRVAMTYGQAFDYLCGDVYPERHCRPPFEKRNDEGYGPLSLRRSSGRRRQRSRSVCAMGKNQ